MRLDVSVDILYLVTYLRKTYLSEEGGRKPFMKISLPLKSITFSNPMTNFAIFFRDRFAKFTIFLARSFDEIYEFFCYTLMKFEIL